MERNYVFIFSSVNNTTWAINYDPSNLQVNKFLSLFDVWGSSGEFKKESSEVWFECSKEFLELSKTPDMDRAFKRMGVKLVYTYPFPVYPTNSPTKWGTLSDLKKQIGEVITVVLNGQELTGKLLGILDKNVEYTYSMFKQEIIQKFPEYFPGHITGESNSPDYWNLRNDYISITSAIHAQPYNRAVISIPDRIVITELKEPERSGGIE